MSSETEARKISAATVRSSSEGGTSSSSSPKTYTSKSNVAPSRRITLNQATRAHLTAGRSNGKRSAASFAVAHRGAGGVRRASITTKVFSNANPQALSGLLGLSTCNSGFLNSLLADVAKAKNDILRAKRGGSSSSSSSSSSEAPSASVKRRRISMPDSANDSPVVAVQQVNRPLVQQKGPSSFLDLLWEESWLKPPVFGASGAPAPAAVAAAARLNPRPSRAAAAVAPARAAAPPPPPPVAAPTIIPATASETFSPLPSSTEEPEDVKLTLQPMDTTTTTTTTSEDDFGWYVDMDEDEDDTNGDNEHPEEPRNDDSHRCVFNPYHTATSSSSSSTSNALAFSAPTAPKRSSHYDAEVEWAKAADTVDDVLGDFF